MCNEFVMNIGGCMLHIYLAYRTNQASTFYQLEAVCFILTLHTEPIKQARFIKSKLTSPLLTISSKSNGNCIFTIENMNIKYILSILLITIVLLSMKYTRTNKLSIAEWYQNAQNNPITNSIDPPCSNTKDIYVCAGICPWYNTLDEQPVTCSFLPRIPNQDFTQNNIYCTPYPDHCPTYNAWLKDNLPQTRRHIKKIPDSLVSNFTLNNKIQIDYSSQDFRNEDTWPVNWTVALLEGFRKHVRAKEAYGTYSNKDIYPALEKYSRLAIENKNCAVIGTENPWIEAALLEYNASSVTTIEYATIHSTVPRLFTITPFDFARRQENKEQRQIFDSLWSYSSLEHDGLGRYRDPLNPYEDLQTMAKLSCLLKPGGLFFLSVPLNIQDFVQFNLHRLYGPIRLPLLYRNFHIVEVLGSGFARTPKDTASQSFVVLQNKVGCKRV